MSDKSKSLTDKTKMSNPTMKVRKVSKNERSVDVGSETLRLANLFSKRKPVVFRGISMPRLEFNKLTNEQVQTHK